MTAARSTGVESTGGSIYKLRYRFSSLLEPAMLDIAQIQSNSLTKSRNHWGVSRYELRLLCRFAPRNDELIWIPALARMRRRLVLFQLIQQIVLYSV